MSSVNRFVQAHLPSSAALKLMASFASIALRCHRSQCGGRAIEGDTSQLSQVLQPWAAEGTKGYMR